MKRKTYAVTIPGTKHATTRNSWNTSLIAARNLVSEALGPDERSAVFDRLENVERLDSCARKAGTIIYRTDTGREIVARVELQP